MNLYYSIAELLSGLRNAIEGDTLVLVDGHYNFNGTLLIKTNHITLKAQNSGGVIFSHGYVGIRIKANGITLSGIQFLNSFGFEKNIIDVFGNNNQIIDLNFNGCSAQKYINIRAGSQYNNIERCNFQNKPISSDMGNLIEVQADQTVPGYNIIRYCSFQHMPGKGGDNGNEPIRIGEGKVNHLFFLFPLTMLCIILPHSSIIVLHICIQVSWKAFHHAQW